MVDRSYMLGKPSPPAAWKVFVDQKVLPVLIDAAGGLEAVVEWLSVQGRTHPGRSAALALAAGYAVCRLTVGRRSRRI